MGQEPFEREQFERVWLARERSQRERSQRERLERMQREQQERMQREQHERAQREQQESAQREQQESAQREQQERVQREQQERAQREREQNRGVAFNCVDCGTTIRLRLLESQAVQRCPSCKTEYKTIRADGEPLVFLVIPKSRNHAESSDTPPKRRRHFPPEVRAALTTFGLGEEAVFDDVRRAYREHVKQYHPDKVGHLGAEIRNLADMKTKEFNSSYQILERFYAT